MKNFWKCGAATALLLVQDSHAAVLTTVPMQGGMIMPMLGYHASEGTLTVHLESTIPELIPLSVSNPEDSFEPGAPWFEALDPSRQSQAFSRRYGFVMDVASDPLPPGTSIWLRKLSSSPGLGIYRYRAMGTPGWEPIFGTAGTTNAMAWEGTMFHPAFTTAPVAREISATFDAFLVDSATGQPIAGASAGPFTFNWKVVADARRPQLEVRQVISLEPSADGQESVVLSWPLRMTNFLVETSLDGESWQPLPSSPLVMEERNVVFLEATNASGLFRLRQNP